MLKSKLSAVCLGLTLLCPGFGSALDAAAEQAKTGGANVSGISVHRILPSDTDERINTFTGNGYDDWAWFDPGSQEKRSELIVFLPGTGSRGKGSAPFNKQAAQWGFHVVSIAYPDKISISHFGKSADPDVFTKARMNIITGKVQFRKLGVNEANSIENRIAALLQYLATHFPQEQWSQFLDEHHALRWGKVILAGQSQGGGHAAIMAMKLHQVARVLMFGSPKDFNRRLNRPAKWYSEGSLTPMDRFFAFNHTGDNSNGCTYPQQLRNYRAMGLMPKYSIVNVDQASPPYGHTRLLTSEMPPKGASAHSAPLHDTRYTQAWRYLLEEPVQ